MGRKAWLQAAWLQAATRPVPLAQVTVAQEINIIRHLQIATSQSVSTSIEIHWRDILMIMESDDGLFFSGTVVLVATCTSTSLGLATFNVETSVIEVLQTPENTDDGSPHSFQLLHVAKLATSPQVSGASGYTTLYCNFMHEMPFPGRF